MHTTWFSNATTTLQWIRVDGGSDSDISSATDLTYTLVTADEGKQVKVKVDFTDDDGHDESLTSDAYPAGSTVLPVDMSGTTGVVSFSGDPTVGTALTATLSDPDNGVSGTPTWQWARSARPDTGFTDISSATGASYTPVEMDRAFFLRATATYSDGGGSGKTATGTTALPVGITSGVFIKNTRQTASPFHNNSPRTLYQGFRTGDNPAGYLLTLVLVGLGGNSGDPIEVQMYRRGPGESGFGSLVYELLPPTDIQSAGDHIVDAPPGAVLEPETDYFLRVTNLNFYTGTTSRNADGGAASGWAISGRASVPGLFVNNTLRILVRGMDLLGPPGPPGSLSATGVAGSAVLTWTAPGSTGQRPVTKYQVRHKQASDPDTAFSAWSDVADSDGDGDLADELSVSVSRPAGTEYTLEVRAVNTNGAGTGAQANVAATDLVPSNWSLIPTGLSTGDKFRLLFLSSTRRNKLSANIADYNTFVQTRAANGHADIRDYSAGFRAVGCTAAVDARDNTKTTYTTTDKGVPIYWLNGAKAADQYEDFYDGSWDDEANDKNESGTNGLDTSLNDNWPLTGCDHDGTEEFALGSSQVRVGRPNSSGSDHGPLSSDSLLGASLTRPLYGLSAVFEVAAAVVVPNNPPAFSADTAARSVAENTAAGQNVGAALTATDADSDTLTYTLEGTDAASFDIVSGSGQIRTRTGVTYNHEAKSTHTVVVKADDGNGGTDTVTVTITVTDVDEPPGRPAAPTVSATAGSTTSLDVTWTAPTNTGPAIASYDLQYRAGTSGNFTNGPQNVTGTSAAIGSLAADTSYEVQVRATNAESDGDWSVAGTGRTTATSAPGAPTGLSATASGTTAINLSWTAPASTGGSAITGYKIEVSPNGTSGWTDQVANTNSTATTYAHTGLGGGTTRHYRVSAINTNGAGTASNVDSATTATTVPGAPTGLTATASGATAINLSWSAPGSTGGSAITGYKIEVSPNGTSGWTDQVANTNSTATTYAHTGLAAGDTRHYRVSAINANGAGTASNVDSATTATTVPGAPTGLTATASGTTAINLSWSAPASTGGSAITGYKIEVSPNGTSGWTDQVANTNSTATTYAHTGLAAGTTRHYRVSAINANGTGTASNVANATTASATAPGASDRPHGHGQRDHRDQHLSWTACRRAAPAAPPTAPPPITGYRIEVSSNGGSSWTNLVANTSNTTTTYAHTGLAAGTTRHYRVSAINANGAGTASNVDSATTATTAPGAPTGLTATASGTTAINLSWSAPGSTGGSAITGYKIEVSPNGTSGWTDQVANTNSTATTYAHTGLGGGTTRHYRVSAINANGAGTASNVDSATTATTVPGPPPASRPRPAGPPRSTSPGAPRAAPAAPPSPATGSRSPPMAAPAGPTSSPTRAIPPPPTRTPG